MKNNLLIVESPNKVKTISKFLPKDFIVEASIGHIRDLPRDEIAVDIKNGFIPEYVVPDEKKKKVNELKHLARNSESVWLATDEDREGEAIAWHLLEELGLDINTTKRVTFNEITKDAIQNAIKKPRKLDMNLVNAQQARRILDRLVGYEISPILWKKVKRGLSAGRVQSVATRLVVEREEEIKKFNTTSYFRVIAELLNTQKTAFKAELKDNLENKISADNFIQRCIGAQYQVVKLETKPAKRTPSAPFTTSSMLQEASRRLGFSIAQTTKFAQSLYENGHITYMRTDSVNLSLTALSAIALEVKTVFGEKYHFQRSYKSKIANAQEAHEAIRPTDFSASVVSSDKSEQKLYELIWKRTVASQMADAEFDRTIATIDILPIQKEPALPQLIAVGEVLKFDGFLALYSAGKEEDEDDSEFNSELPPLKEGDMLSLKKMTATEKYTRHPPRYSEASLVKKLEELGIGRPSTFKSMVHTIQEREYVVKESREGVQRKFVEIVLLNDKVTTTEKTEKTGTETSKLFPTDLGVLVNQFLVKNFSEEVDYNFTKKLEEEFDEISCGKLEWKNMLKGFYPNFHKKVEKTEETAERVSGERLLGTDPKTGKPVVARLGRFGPLVQIGNADDTEKVFAGLIPGQRIDLITLEQALELFKLPRVIGEYNGEPVKANFGRFGPYLLYKTKYYPIAKGHTPLSVNIDEAIKMIESKIEADAQKVQKTFDDPNYAILKGRFGFYLVAHGQNVKLPKGAKIEDLTLDDCIELAKDVVGKDTGKVKKGGKSNFASSNTPEAEKTSSKPKRTFTRKK